MAYREVAMWEILSVLGDRFRGENLSAISRRSGHSRMTVRRYLRTAEELGWDAEQKPSEELARKVYQKLRPVASGSGLGSTEQVLMTWRKQIEAWLKPPAGEKRGLRLTKVAKLLRRRGVEVPYSSLHRFAVRYCGFADRRRITVRLADPAPGEYSEVDFGRLGYACEPGYGRRLVHGLVVTLSYSRHQFLWPLHRYRLTDLIEGLEEAWLFFGGTSVKVILDNMKAAIHKADRYDPVFIRVFEEYARWRGFVIDPARVRHPKDKGLISYCTACVG